MKSVNELIMIEINRVKEYKDELYYSIGTNNFRRYYIETLYDYANRSSTTKPEK